MAEIGLARAEESVATAFSRSMNAATSPWGVITDLSVASAIAAIPIVLIVKQIGGGEARSVTTYVLVVLALSPVIAAIAASIHLRNARAGVVAWLAAQPFPVENVNALLVGLTDSFEVVFAKGVTAPTRDELQRRLEPISDDTLATEASAEDRRLEVKIGVIESKRLPLRSAFQRWQRFQRIVTEVLVPMSRDREIARVRVLLNLELPTLTRRLAFFAAEVGPLARGMVRAKRATRDLAALAVHRTLRRAPRRRTERFGAHPRRVPP